MNSRALRLLLQAKQADGRPDGISLYIHMYFKSIGFENTFRLKQYASHLIQFRSEEENNLTKRV